MKKILCILLICIMCTTGQLTAFAAAITLPSGTSSSEIESQIDSYVQNHQDTTAAMSVAVFTSDKVLMNKAYGYTDLEKGIANNSEAVFEWGSCTKLMTWVSVMQLTEKGLINLNSDIRTYLPDGFFKKLKYDKPITMLNLMNHNAGWQELASDLFVNNKKNIKDLGEALRYTEPEQIFEPGEIEAYSNWGAALAGYIVERVSGQSFSDYVHKNIFDPLDMKHTAISPDLSDNKWVAKQRLREKCYTEDKKSLGTCFHYISLYPAGMATGTISDFTKFAQALLSKGKASPLFSSAKTLDEMLSPSLYYANSKAARNCHGFWTDQFKVPVIWHDGGTIGSTSWFAFNQESGTGVVILTNQRDESVYTCGLLPLIFGKYKYTSNAITSGDISGTYQGARSCFKGYTKLFSLFTTMKVVPSKKGSYTISDTNETITGISNNSYLLDMGGRKQFVLYSNKDAKGRTILQIPGKDYIKINGYSVLAKFGLLLLFAIAVLYCLIVLIVKAVRTLLHKKPNPMGKLHTLVNASVIVCLSFFLYITYILLMTNTPMYQDIHWCLIASSVLAAFPVIYTILLILKWKGLICTKKAKVSLIINCIMVLIASFNVYFWII